MPPPFVALLENTHKHNEPHVLSNQKKPGYPAENPMVLLELCIYKADLTHGF